MQLMWRSPSALPSKAPVSRPRKARPLSRVWSALPRAQRRFTVLAIETSCDDTSVAIVDVKRVQPTAVKGNDEPCTLSLKVHFHERITANNDAYTGIHPLVALHAHRSNLAPLIARALKTLQPSNSSGSQQDGAENKVGGVGFEAPDLVAVTRGPGMRSNLAVGLDTAKGLATAWDVPLIGVHHMQAHALTPRLLTAMANHEACHAPQDSQVQQPISRIVPAFPFLSVLVSGGHTMLIDSAGLTEHATLAETQDIALGDFLDKAARAILPIDRLKAPYGRALEQFAFEEGDNMTVDSVGTETPPDLMYNYTPPTRRQDELEARPTEWGWTLSPPLAESRGAQKSSRRMMFSFAGLLTAIERLVKRSETFTLTERRYLARETQRLAFEHLASRILLHLSSPTTNWAGDTIVVSGGVASNAFLRHVLRRILDIRGYPRIKLSFPPIALCTDNALMIAWAGVEMFNVGYTSRLDIWPIRKWSMDPRADDGGILGVDGWIEDTQRSNKNKIEPIPV